MHFSSVLSDLLDTEAALEELLTEVTETFYEGGREADATTGDPDLIVVFFSSHHRHNALYLGERIRETFPHASILGCSAGGVVGAHKELEGEPALAITAARLPGVALQTFQLEPEDLQRSSLEEPVFLNATCRNDEFIQSTGVINVEPIEPPDDKYVVLAEQLS